MVQVDLPAAFTIGQLLALYSKKYFKKEPDIFKNKLLGPLNLYLSCGFAPAGLFLLICWPAWELMYITNWVENPFNNPLVAGFYIGFGIIMILLGNAGFMLGHYFYRRNKDKLVILGAIIGGALTILPFLLRWGIWWKVGTQLDIETNMGYSFWQPPFFYGWLIIMSYLVATTVLALLWFKKVSGKI
jgi:hypothetical protein